MAIDPALKTRIDAMDRVEMARVWRHAPTGDERLQGEAGDYFAERFESLGGFSPAISRAIGW